MAAALGKCGSRHWNRAGSKPLRLIITTARPARLACVKNDRQGLPATPGENYPSRGLSGLSRSLADLTAPAPQDASRDLVRRLAAGRCPAQYSRQDARCPATARPSSAT